MNLKARLMSGTRFIPQAKGKAMSDIVKNASNRASVREQAAIDKLLWEHCEKVGEFCRYREGWSDQRIAKECSIPEKLSSVIYRRKQLLGLFEKPAKPADSNMAAIAEAVNWIMSSMGEKKRLITGVDGVLTFGDPASTDT